MDGRFRRLLPFAAHSVQVNGSQEQIVGALERCMLPIPLVRYNFSFPNRPYRLIGQIRDGAIHLTVSGWQGGYSVFHGSIQPIDEHSCQVIYRILPNNYCFLSILILLCFCFVYLISRAAGPIWPLGIIALFALLVFVFFTLSTLLVNERLNEILNEYLE